MSKAVGPLRDVPRLLTQKGQNCFGYLPGSLQPQMRKMKGKAVSPSSDIPQMCFSWWKDMVCDSPCGPAYSWENAIH